MIDLSDLRERARRWVGLEPPLGAHLDLKVPRARRVDLKVFDLIEQSATDFKRGLPFPFDEATERLHRLLRQGATVECQRFETVTRRRLLRTRTPLGLAAAEDIWPWISVFHALHLPLDTRDQFGCSPAACASVMGAAIFLRKLREFGADIPMARNGVGASLLDEAVRLGEPELVRDLISWGVDVNVKDRDGRTALFHTTSVEFTRLLIDAGADVNVVDREGWSILEIHVREALRAAGSREYIDVPEELVVPCEGNTILDLVAAGADVDVRSFWTGTVREWLKTKHCHTLLAAIGSVEAARRTAN